MVFKIAIKESVLKLIRHFKNYPLGILASELKAFLVNAPKEMGKLERKFVSWKPNTRRPIGDVLLCYENRAFLLKPGDPFPIDHTNRWESWQIAKTFVDLGYRVDVINENNFSFVPTNSYAFFVGNRINFDRIAGLLNKGCIKILHVDTSHWLFNNMAEYRRLELLKQRRGFALHPDRYLTPNYAIERAEYATVLGNEFTVGTYKYANKPLFRVPISTPVVYPWQDDKEFDRVRKSFLWLGSEGFVHKGLDLVLEAFAQMPDYHLTVCGPIHTDQNFQNAYRDELYKTPNICTVGWVDVSSPKFIEIVNDCVGIVFPSCAEGGGGGVITCLHAGLIPIVSREASVDVDETRGVMLKESSVDEIKASVQTLSALPAPQLAEMSKRNWDFARTNHTRETFAASYSRAVSEIVTAEAKKRQSATNPVKRSALFQEGRRLFSHTSVQNDPSNQS
jgi:glycosyltransferase involved in cell wall biosynthesis